jgi:hypothetical protein
VLSSEYHTELVRQIVDFNLTSKQVKEICEGSVDEVDVKPIGEETISQAVLRIARATRNSGDMSGADLARANATGT